MVPMDIIFILLIVALTVVLPIYFILLLKLNSSSEPKLITYITKAAERKSKKPPKKTQLATLVKPLPEEKTRNILPKEEAIDNFPEGEKDCSHYTGYLTTLPKDSHVPDECFGCRNVIQCMRIEPTKVIESFYVKE
jgi:hypothetical protein